MARTIEAIYEDGVLKPVEPLQLAEHTKVRITVETKEEALKRAESILELARRSYEGLSEEEISAVEEARLDSKSFFTKK